MAISKAHGSQHLLKKSKICHKVVDSFKKTFMRKSALEELIWSCDVDQ